MGLYFGTDGLRGVINEDLTFDLAYKCGNSLAQMKQNPTILIGSDTRISKDYITLAVAGGAMSCGAKVIDLGIIPTAGIAYLTKTLGADYGVVISASHNTAEYNGIKMFDKNGYKMMDKEVETLERKLIQNQINKFPSIGTYTQDFSLVKKYEDFLVNTVKGSLKGLTIVLDGSNGAAHKIAPAVFRKLGAKVIATNCRNDGLKINENCGSLNPQNLAKMVVKYKADMGFAFDGDSDRIIAIDERGEIIDGDRIIFALGKLYKEKGLLQNNAVVGTSHTNMGIQLALEHEGIELVRSDIGDKYVLEKLIERNLVVGGEQSGHIILKNISTTGDGVLTGVQLASLTKSSGKKMSELAKVELFPQTNINIPVKDKLRIINSELLAEEITRQRKILGEHARIMVRASGTEPKVRVMVETRDAKQGKASAEQIQNVIKAINNEE